jgi:chromosome segregation ATPase
VGRLAEMVLQFPASFANRLDEAMRQIEVLSRDLREENRQTEALDKENRDLKKEISDLQKENIDIKEQQRALREEIDGKRRDIQELRFKYELSSIEKKTNSIGLNLQDFSPSQVQLK